MALTISCTSSSSSQHSFIPKVAFAFLQSCTLIFFILFSCVGFVSQAFSSIPSCTGTSSNYQTAQYSLDYCNSACSGSCSTVSNPGCTNYCADGCCSYCICDPCADVSPSPAEQCGGSQENVVSDSDSTEKSCDFHCKCPDYSGQKYYDFDTCEAQPDPCADVDPSPAEDCGSIEDVIWDDESTCSYHCDDSCPDSDADGLPDCCGGNVDCPDSDDDGIYDCCGDGAPCSDADEDGAPDSCDPCPNDPSITTKEICVYLVDNYCDGIGSYSVGDVCGTSTTTCESGTDCRDNGPGYVRNDSECGFYCCSVSSCYSEPCRVDPVTCKAANCICPGGESACAECQAPNCVCPNGETEYCEECQVPDPREGCECPDGLPSPCDECQDPECICDDGTTEACEECQYPPPDDGTCSCPDGSTACDECQKPDCTCDDGTTDSCEECQEPLPPSGPEPEPFDPGAIPDSFYVGECLINVTEMKEWLLGDESFPFNFIYAFSAILGPLKESSYSEDYRLVYSMAPPNDPHFADYEMVLDLSEYPILIGIGNLTNWSISITLVFSLIVYAVKRYHNFHGISR